MSALVG